jgi:hypothetical protein
MMFLSYIIKINTTIWSIGVSLMAYVESKQQIPPLRCGMTKKKTKLYSMAVLL